MALILLAIVARVTLGSWVAPGAFFALFWAGLIAISVNVEDYPLWPPALWWINGNIFVFYAGSLISKLWIPRRTRSSKHSEVISVRFPYLSKIIALCCLLGICYILFREIFTPNRLDKPPASFQILLAAMTAAPLFGGMLFATCRSRWERAIAILPLGVSLAYAVSYLGRGPMLAGIYLWCAGYWSTRIFQEKGAVPFLTAKLVAFVPFLLLGLAAAGTAIGALRGATNELALEDRVRAYPHALQGADPEKEWAGFRHGVLSHPYAFSHYLKHALVHPPDLRYGMGTFGGLVELLGIRERGTYETFEPDPGVRSNVYTLFMPPIVDFGLAGAWFSFLAAGLLAGWAFGRVAQGNLVLSPILNMFYPHVLVIGGYFFSYNSLTLAHSFVALYLWFAPIRQFRPGTSARAQVSSATHPPPSSVQAASML